MSTIKKAKNRIKAEKSKKGINKNKNTTTLISSEPIKSCSNMLVMVIIMNLIMN